MVIRVCPKCEKAFYAVADADVIKCGRCGYVIADRRNTDRVAADADFFLSSHGIKIRAKLEDYSDRGLRALYKGRRLDVNSEFYVDLEKFGIKGQVRTVWSKKRYGSLCESGFKIMRRNGTHS